MKTETREFPCWFEISQEEGRLKGRFVGKWGSAEPMTSVLFQEELLEFSIGQAPENLAHEVVFKGRLVGDALEGTTLEKGKTLSWRAVRAPSLARNSMPAWGETVQLFNGKDLTGWKLSSPHKRNGWKAVEGTLVNTPASDNLITDQKFEDFKLHVEFKIEE